MYTKKGNYKDTKSEAEFIYDRHKEHRCCQAVWRLKEEDLTLIYYGVCTLCNLGF